MLGRQPTGGIGAGLITAGIVTTMLGFPFWVIGGLGVSDDVPDHSSVSVKAGPTGLALMGTF